MKVELYSLDDNAEDELVGTIIMNGKDLSGDTELAKHILTMPVWLANGRTVYAQENPQMFFENLYQHYKSFALRATQPIK